MRILYPIAILVSFIVHSGLRIFLLCIEKLCFAVSEKPLSEDRANETEFKQKQRVILLIREKLSANDQEESSCLSFNKTA